MASYRIPNAVSVADMFRNSHELVYHPITVLERNLERFGDTFASPIGLKRRMIVTRDPSFVEYVLRKNHRNYAKSEILTDILSLFLGHGLLTSNGEFWLRQRRLIQPGFHPQKLSALFLLIEKAINEFLRNMPVGKQIDVYPYMNQLAFEIVVKSLFNVEIPSETLKRLSSVISDVQHYVIREVRQPFKRAWFRLSGQRGREMRKAQNARGIIRQIVLDRKNSGREKGDLLDMLLAARYEDNGEPMEMEQLIDELMILVVAGHETTANALAWMLYLLSENPYYIERIVETSSLSIDDAFRDPLLNNIVNESMRLFPPAWISDRLTLEDDSFGEYTYPKDTLVVTFLYGMHRHPGIWDEADRFKPERFLKENLTPEISKAFYPFGSGPRMCIGNNFAMAEMTLFLQAFFKNFRIQSIGYQPQKIALVTLRPDRVMLNIERI